MKPKPRNECDCIETVELLTELSGKLLKRIEELEKRVEELEDWKTQVVEQDGRIE